MAYADDIPQQDGIGRFGGIHLTKPGIRHSIFTLGGDKGPTDFRAFPEIDVNGAEVPYRVSAGDFQFSYFMRPEKVVRRMGLNEKFTCFTRVLGRERSYVGPVDRFVTTLSRAIKDKVPNLPSEWVSWRESKNPALSRVEMSGLMQGMIFAHGSKQYIDQSTGQYSPVFPALLILPKSARENIEELCNTEAENYQGSPEDYARRYKAGDFLSCAGGKIMRFMYFPQQGHTISHYKVAIQPTPVPLDPAFVQAHWKPWDQLLRFLTEEEQLQQLIQNFPPEAVDYVFGHSDLAPLLPKSVLGRWHAKGVTVGVPAAIPSAYSQFVTPPQQDSVPWDGPSHAVPAAPPVVPTVTPVPSFPNYAPPAVVSGVPAMPSFVGTRPFTAPAVPFAAPNVSASVPSAPSYGAPTPQPVPVSTDARQRLEEARRQLDLARNGGAE